MKRMVIPSHGPKRLSGLVRCQADYGQYCCDLCKNPTQEQAGNEYFELLDWNMCCARCWDKMCEDYWKWLDGNKNSIINFCNYITEEVA